MSEAKFCFGETPCDFHASGSSVPEAAMEAAYDAAAGYWSDGGYTALVDAAVHAAAPFIVAAASVELQQEVDRLSAECEALRGTVAKERATTGAEEWQPEPHVTLFIDDLTALLNDCSQTGDWLAEFPAYVAVWAVRDLLNKAFAREIQWAAESDSIVRALHEAALASPGEGE